MRRSNRCKHGFCLDTVGCEQCGVKVAYEAGKHLRRATERARVGKPAPATYRGQGRTAMHGNSNRGFKY